MNSTFFMVISIVVVFLLLLLFFQTSCDNTNKNNKISENDYYNDYENDSELFQSTNDKARLYIQVDNHADIDIKYLDSSKNKLNLKTGNWYDMKIFDFDSDFEEIEVRARNTGGPGGLIAKIVIGNNVYLMTNDTKQKYRLEVMNGQSIVSINDKYGNVGGWRSRTNSNLRSSNWVRGSNGRVRTTYTLKLIGRPKKKLKSFDSKKNSELQNIMEGGPNDTFQNSNNTNSNVINNSSNDSVSQIKKMLSGESDAELGIYRYETNVVNVPNENQSLLSIGNFNGINPLTKGFQKTNTFIKWIGYIYCKEPEYYRFFLEANCGTVKISKDPLPINNVKQLFQIDEARVENGKKQQQSTTFENENFNADEELISIVSPRDYFFSGGRYRRRPPSIVPKSKLKALKHGVYRIEILTWTNYPINFYYTNNSNLLFTKIFENKSQVHYETRYRYYSWWHRHPYRVPITYNWKEFNGFNNLKNDLKTITNSTTEPLIFFNFGKTNKSRFPGGKEGIVKLQYDKFQNTNPASIINQSFAIQKLGHIRNITFRDEFLIEFDIKVNKAITNWGNIFRITANDNNCCNRLDRVVAMWLFGFSNSRQSPTKVHLSTGNQYSGNYTLDGSASRKLEYAFTIGVRTRVSIFTKKNSNGERILSFIAQKFDDKGKLSGDTYRYLDAPIGINSGTDGRQLRLIISDRHHYAADAELRNFTFSTSTGPTYLNYIRRIAVLKYATRIEGFSGLGSINVTSETAIMANTTMPNNFIFEINISDLGNSTGDFTGELFSINRMSDDTFDDKEPIMVLIKDSANQFKLIWNKFSSKTTIRFLVENTRTPNRFKLLFLLTESRMSIFQDVGTNEYVGLVKSYPIDNGSVIAQGSVSTDNTEVYLSGPAYNGKSSSNLSYTLNPIPQFYNYNKDNPKYKYLDPSFKCEDLTNEGQDKCGPGGTISARLNKECKWYNPNNAEMLLEPLNLEEPNEFSKFKEHTDQKFGKNTPICINSVDAKKCFMQDPSEGECQDLPCVIHPHESGKPICLHMKDKPKVELTQPNHFKIDINPKFPISTIAAIENPDNSKIEDLSQVINNQNDKLQALSKEIERLETLEGFSNFDNQGNNIDKIQSINQATTLYASPMENNETSFKLHVNGKCVTVYDKEKLLLTECQPNLVGHGFKKNRINNNLVAKVETGTEPIMSDSNYPYPYEMIKSDLTSQCLNIDLKNNLTMQDCNPDKVDQFFRSQYTQKS